jgi:hypothetical protein
MPTWCATSVLKNSVAHIDMCHGTCTTKSKKCAPHMRVFLVLGYTSIHSKDINLSIAIALKVNWVAYNEI